MKLRSVIVHAPLPMLALAAAYGVYQFNILFMPEFFAFVAAAAFELTYIGLAFTRTADANRARNIATAAVVVSVLYNTLAGLFHRQPGWLEQVPWYGEIALAVLHGLPLAVVAYNVSMLLHGNAQQPSTAEHDPNTAEQRPYDLEQTPITVGQFTFTIRELAILVEQKPSTLYGRMQKRRALLEQASNSTTDAELLELTDRAL